MLIWNNRQIYLLYKQWYLDIARFISYMTKILQGILLVYSYFYRHTCDNLTNTNTKVHHELLNYPSISSIISKYVYIGLQLGRFGLGLRSVQAQPAKKKIGFGLGPT